MVKTQRCWVPLSTNLLHVTFICEHTHKCYGMQAEAQGQCIGVVCPLHSVDIKSSSLVASTFTRRTISMDPLPRSSIPASCHCLEPLLMWQGMLSQFLPRRQCPALHLRAACGQDCCLPYTHHQRNVILWGFL